MHLKPTRALLSVVLLLLLAAWLMSCADVPSTGPTSPELVSEYRFVNGAEDLSNVGVAVDGAAVGNLTYKGATAHSEFPSGSRVAVLSSNDTLRIGMESYQRGTIVFLPMTGPVREFLKLVERRIFDPASTNEALVRIVHAAAAPDLYVKITGSGGNFTLRNRAYKSATEYLHLPTGDYTISVATAADTTTVIASSALSAANKRQTSLILGSTTAGTLSLSNLADD